MLLLVSLMSKVCRLFGPMKWLFFFFFEKKIIEVFWARRGPQPKMRFPIFYKKSIGIIFRIFYKKLLQHIIKLYEKLAHVTCTGVFEKGVAENEILSFIIIWCSDFFCIFAWNFNSVNPNITEAVARRCSVIKSVVLKNFPKFTEKHLCQSLYFNKVADLRPANLVK